MRPWSDHAYQARSFDGFCCCCFTISLSFIHEECTCLRQAFDIIVIAFQRLPSRHRVYNTIHKQYEHSNPRDIHSGSFEDLVTQLFLLTLLVRHLSGVDRHVCVCPGGSTLRQCSGIDDEDALDDLGGKTHSVSFCPASTQHTAQRLAYLYKWRQHTGRDQHVRPHVPPLSQLEVAHVQHGSGCQAAFRAGPGQVLPCGGREDGREVPLLDEIPG